MRSRKDVQGLVDEHLFDTMREVTASMGVAAPSYMNVYFSNKKKASAFANSMEKLVGSVRSFDFGQGSFVQIERGDKYIKNSRRVKELIRISSGRV